MFYYVLLCFAMFCYVLPLCFRYVLLCFPMFLLCFAMLVGFSGALIVLRPDIELGFGPLLILCASLMWSSSMLMAKTLTKTDTISSITFWQAAGLIPATFILAIPPNKL